VCERERVCVCEEDAREVCVSLVGCVNVCMCVCVRERAYVGGEDISEVCVSLVVCACVRM